MDAATTSPTGRVNTARLVVPNTVTSVFSGAFTVGPAPFVTGAKFAVTFAATTPAGNVFPVIVTAAPGCAAAGVTAVILTCADRRVENEKIPTMRADADVPMRVFIEIQSP